MIWSFTKIALFVALIAAGALGTAYLMENGGNLRISLANLEFTFGPVQAVVAAMLLLFAVWLTLRILGLILAVIRFLNGDETAISRYFDRNRERRGFQALSEGMLALASGEGRVAMAKAAKAEKYLARPDLTNLLSAQAAELSGDTKTATEVYKRLLTDDQTRFVGVRGLMRQKIAEGDTGTALKLAEKAFSLKPRHQEVQDALLKLRSDAGDWKGAREVLGTKMRQGLLPRDVHKRRDAVMALQEAKVILDDSSSVEAREAAIAANKASPDLIPAAAMAARSYVAAGKPKYADRILKKAWEAQPHPDLAAAYAAIAPDESPAERLRRFDNLLRLRADHPESRMLRAELMIAAEDFPGARRALGDLIDTHPTARALTIMAAVERGEGGEDASVRGWLTRALTASRGPQWICDKCHAVHADWGPVCDNCGGFDTLSWREAPMSANPMANGADMLPLIVGRPTAVSAAEPESVTASTESESPDDGAATERGWFRR
jgi:HemY protein